MKKRVCSLALALAVMLSLLPTGAIAAGGGTAAVTADAFGVKDTAYGQTKTTGRWTASPGLNDLSGRFDVVWADGEETEAPAITAQLEYETGADTWETAAGFTAPGTYRYSVTATAAGAKYAAYSGEPIVLPVSIQVKKDLDSESFVIRDAGGGIVEKGDKTYNATGSALDCSRWTLAYAEDVTDAAGEITPAWYKDETKVTEVKDAGVYMLYAQVPETDAYWGTSDKGISVIQVTVTAGVAVGPDDPAGGDNTGSESGSVGPFTPEAIASGAVTLTEDAVVTASVGIPQGTSVTLNLAGHTLTFEGDGNVYVSGTLTVSDTGGGEIVNSSADVYSETGIEETGGTIVVNGGTWSGTPALAAACLGGSIQITGGTFNGPILRVADVGLEGHVTISGGTFNSAVSVEGEVTVSGGTFETGASIFASTVTVSGGSFRARSPFSHGVDGLTFTEDNAATFTQNPMVWDHIDELQENYTVSQEPSGTAFVYCVKPGATTLAGPVITSEPDANFRPTVTITMPASVTGSIYYDEGYGYTLYQNPFSHGGADPVRAYIASDTGSATVFSKITEADVSVQKNAERVTYDYASGRLTWTMPAGTVIDAASYTNSWFVVYFEDGEGNAVNAKGSYSVGTAQSNGDAAVTLNGLTYSCTLPLSGLPGGTYTVRIVNERLFTSLGCTARFTVGGSSGNPGGSTGSDDRDDRDDSDDSGHTTTVSRNGTVIKTVTDPVTGTVTETTTTRDGTKTVVETKKDGTITTTVTQKSGTTATTTRSSGGSYTAVVSLSPSAAETARNSVFTLPVKVDANGSTVEVSGVSASATVNIPLTQVTNTTVAVITGRNGESIVKAAVPANGGLTVSLDGSATLTIRDNAKRFTDVPANFWSRDAVDFVTSRELFNGTAGGTFTPSAPMTRQMLMTVLARLDGADTSVTPYEKGMAWAVGKGISDGSSPTGTISREQLAVMLYRYAGSPASSGSLDRFPDSASVGGYARDAMCWAVERGILSGTANGALAPKGQATRAQVAAMLQRYVVSTFESAGRL